MEVYRIIIQTDEYSTEISAKNGRPLRILPEYKTSVFTESVGVIIEVEKERENSVAYPGLRANIITELIVKNNRYLEIVQEGATLKLIERERAPLEKWGDYTNPPIYPGWNRIPGATWDGENGAYAKDEHGWDMVWIPVGALSENGTLDGINYNQKFGKRKFSHEYEDFSENGYHQTYAYNYIQTIRKEGGFYVASCPASLGSNGKVQFVKDFYAFAINTSKCINYRNVLANFNYIETLTTGWKFLSGAQYDSIVEWLRINGYNIEDSSLWGNYYYTKNSPRELLPIGSRVEWQTKGLVDFAGSLWWITEEKYAKSHTVIRGGSYRGDGVWDSVDCRMMDAHSNGMIKKNTHPTHLECGFWGTPYRKE